MNDLIIRQEVPKKPTGWSPVFFHENAYFDKTPLGKQRVCCNCKHRTKPDSCDIDGHFISYLACFTAWCRRWKKEEDAAEGMLLPEPYGGEE